MYSYCSFHRLSLLRSDLYYANVVNPDSKALTKLKKKYSKLTGDRGVALFKKLLLSYSPGWLVIFVLRKYYVKSDYKSARESIKFFQLSHRAYGAGKARKNQRLLRIALNLLGDRLPEPYISMLHIATATTLKDPTTRNSFSNLILQATKEVPVRIFDASHWYQLSRGLFSLGYFRAAWVARENSLDLSISETLVTNVGATTLQRGIEAHLERRNFPDAGTAIRHSTSKISADCMSEFYEYFSMMQGLVVDPSDLKGIGHEALVIFDNLIFEKEVALVGMGPPTGEYGQEIDAADTVIRLKFVGLENLPDSKYHGARCEISQYNDVDPLLVISATKIEPKFFQSLKLVISSSASATMILDIPIFNPKFEIPLYRTTATSGIRCLKTIVSGKPKSLKIYGFDFYSILTQYDGNALKFYKSNGWMLGHPNFVSSIPEEIRRKLSFPYSFSAHDPVSNFCYAQNLYKAGLFQIEPYGKSILELTPYQYVQRLEEMLGDW